MKQYLDLVKHVLRHGSRKENRTGIDTLSCFNYNYSVDLADGFPILTTKKISWKNIVIELLWFLSGSARYDFLERHGCNFWSPWYNSDGSVKNCYGPAWRAFPVTDSVPAPSYYMGRVQMTQPGVNDQIRWVVDELKRNPLSRRLVVSAWAPGVAQIAPLPPCHCMFILNVQEDPRRLCLHLSQRSNDISLGTPYNLTSYALLLHLFSRFSGIAPGEFAHSLVDAHIYTAKPDGSKSEYDHIPGLREQLTRKTFLLPKLIIDKSIRTLDDVERLLLPDVTTADILNLFRLEGYQSHPAIPFKVAP